MSILKLIGYMLAAFLLPVLLSLFLVSLFFGSSDATTALRSRDNVSESTLGELKPDVEPIASGTSFAVVKSDGWLDPDKNSKFFVSFNVRFDKLPPIGMRHNIVSKYAAKTHPYPGWAVALHRLKTSMRPEVYLRGINGNGGWFTFDNISVVPDTWYAFSLVMKSDEFVSLYVQNLGNSEDGEGAVGSTTHLGAYDISRVHVTKTESDLYLGTIRKGPKGFMGEVNHVLLARPTKMADVADKMKSFLTGGPLSVVERFDNDEIYLWMTGRGRDESKYARRIEFTGRPSWRVTQ